MVSIMTAPRQSRQITLRSRPRTGEPLSPCLSVDEVDVPSPPDGFVVVKNLSFRPEPTCLGWMKHKTYLDPIGIGEPIRVGGIAEVVESRHPDFREGDRIFGRLYAQELSLLSPADLEQGESGDTSCSIVGKAPSAADPAGLAAILASGVAAYVGVRRIARVQPNDVVLVSGASGNVGSLACQLAKKDGAYVIGMAGGPQACERVVEVFGADAAVDYRLPNPLRAVRKLAPEGVNATFDNVGGYVVDLALRAAAEGSVVLLCGGSGIYNDPMASEVTNAAFLAAIFKRVQIQGFVNTDFRDSAESILHEMSSWLNEGSLVVDFTTRSGLSSLVSALEALHEGGRADTVVVLNEG